MQGKGVKNGKKQSLPSRPHRPHHQQQQQQQRKRSAGSSHGPSGSATVQRKGRVEIAPKKASLIPRYKLEKKLTAERGKSTELILAAKASTTKPLSVLKNEAVTGKAFVQSKKDKKKHG